MHNIYAVVVAFFPSASNLLKMVSELVEQGVKVIIVNNTPGHLISLPEFSNGFVINLQHNKGIAEAQNIGVRYALDCNATHICFFDQDSIIPNEYIQEMIVASSIYNHRCLLAPVAIDDDTGGEIPSHKINRFGYPCNHYSLSGVMISNTDIVISSGMFTSSAIFHEVGLMDVDYFIDFVDIEFCIRLKKAGIPVFVIPSLSMRHRIGDGEVSVLGLKTSIHSGIRTYYKTRNAFVFMYKMGPSIFSFVQLFAGILHGFLSSVHDFPSIDRMRFYLKGIVHGLMFKRGALSE